MDIKDIKIKISPVLEKYGVTKADLFGSFSRGEQRADSDVDLLIRVDRSQKQKFGLFELMDLKEELISSLGRDVDVVMEDSINKFLRPYIIPELKTIYEK